MKYWAVTTAFYDNGRVTGYRETRSCDIYTDWFDNYQNALDFVKEAREC